MLAMRGATILSVAALLTLAGLPAVAQGQNGNDDLAALKTQLLQLKVNPYPPPRERSAQILSALIRRMDVSVIDKATIDEIAGLLEDNSDTVRGRMAIALGNIGAPAKHTVPALEKAFVRAKEYVAAGQSNLQPTIGFRAYGLGTSADSICDALAKLEAPAPTGCIQVGSVWRYESPTAPVPAGPVPAN
jgi:hypothetical protein